MRKFKWSHKHFAIIIMKHVGALTQSCSSRAKGQPESRKLGWGLPDDSHYPAPSPLCTQDRAEYLLYTSYHTNNHNRSARPSQTSSAALTSQTVFCCTVRYHCSPLSCMVGSSRISVCSIIKMRLFEMLIIYNWIVFFKGVLVYGSRIAVLLAFFWPHICKSKRLYTL